MKIYFKKRFLNNKEMFNEICFSENMFIFDFLKFTEWKSIEDLVKEVRDYYFTTGESIPPSDKDILLEVLYACYNFIKNSYLNDYPVIVKIENKEEDFDFIKKNNKF